MYIPIHTKKVWTCRTNRLIRTNRSIRLPVRSLETSLDQKQTRPEFVSRKKNSKLKKMSLVWNRSLDRVSIGKNYKPNVGAVWFGIFLVSVSIGLILSPTLTAPALIACYRRMPHGTMHSSQYIGIFSVPSR